jgi:hypothetical protein
MSGHNMIVRFIVGLLFVVQPVLAISAEGSKCDLPQQQVSGSSPGEERALFEQSLTTTDHLRQMAATAGAEWLETEGLLIRAREEARDSNWKTAFQLVQKACHQAELALQQAEYESGAWKNRVVD